MCSLSDCFRALATGCLRSGWIVEATWQMRSIAGPLLIDGLLPRTMGGTRKRKVAEVEQQ
jgi:hypothetical protein